MPSYYDHEGNSARLPALDAVAAELGATPSQVALNWLMDGDPLVIPVIGVSLVAQLDECLDAADVNLDGDLRERLDDADRTSRPATEEGRSDRRPRALPRALERTL